jgi:Icc protein
VLVLSHIPILCACALLDGDNEKSGDWVVPGAWMHTDARRIKDLFYRHPNVKLAISGHIHLRDRLDYNGVTYLCNGAVCGAWWKGNYQETEPGYSLIDLYDDGTFDQQYVAYGRETVADLSGSYTCAV